MSVWSKAEKIFKPFKRFAKSENGNISMLLGLSVIPLLVSGGAAIDYERAVNAKTQLLASLDSAALYAANMNSTDTAVLTAAAQAYVQQNYNNVGDAKLTSFAVSATSTTVTATAQVQLTNYFMSIVGQNTTTVMATSTADKAGINLEVSMALDNTGSMGQPMAGHALLPIDELKAAASKFVDMVMPPTQGAYYTKIAAVPYNTAVNPGSMAAANTLRGGTLAGTSTIPGYTNLKFTNMAGGTTTTGAITQCLTERTGAQAYTDASVALYPVGRQYAAKGGTYTCAVTPFLPLSTSATNIKATINNMSAAGYTAGQVGLAWTWYMLSPTFGYFTGESVPAGYDKLTTSDLTKKVKKIMILMTDGEYNSAYVDGVFSGQKPAYESYINYSSSDVNIKPPSNDYAINQAVNICSATKATGVELYVITFQLDPTHPERVTWTKNCATDAAHLIDGDGGGLDAAFTQIANNIKNLRLTN